MIVVFSCRYFFLPHWNCNSGKVDVIKIIIAKRLHHVLKTKEYKAYLEVICLIFDGYTRLY